MVERRVGCSLEGYLGHVCKANYEKYFMYNSKAHMLFFIFSFSICYYIKNNLKHLNFFLNNDLFLEQIFKKFSPKLVKCVFICLIQNF